MVTLDIYILNYVRIQRLSVTALLEYAKKQNECVNQLMNIPFAPPCNQEDNSNAAHNRHPGFMWNHLGRWHVSEKEMMSSSSGWQPSDMITSCYRSMNGSLHDEGLIPTPISWYVSSLLIIKHCTIVVIICRDSWILDSVNNGIAQYYQSYSIFHSRWVKEFPTLVSLGCEIRACVIGSEWFWLFWSLFLFW